MMKKIVIIAISVICISFHVHAQSSTTNRPYIITKLQQQESNQGRIQVIQDKRIDELLSKVVDRNAQRGTVRGYRIQIFRENSQVAQERARAARSKFVSNFPDIEVHEVVKAPLWRVYIGDFRTLNDAYRMLKQIEPLFPNAFIIREDIDYNKL